MASKNPKEKREDQLKLWQKRVDQSTKLYESWADRYKVEKLEDYFLGHQWPEGYEENYVINLFYPSINIRKPSLYFFNPRAKVEPKGPRLDDFGSSLQERANLRQDILNTLIEDKNLNFARETHLALHESHFRFGLVEVGYSADFTDNPNVGKPVLRENSDQPLMDGNEPVIDTRERIPERERVFVKRIPADTFRVSLRSSEDLHKCDWCGYFEWHYPEDIRRNPKYKNNKEIKATGEVKKELWPGSFQGSEDDSDAWKEMVLIWKIWDVRTGRRFVFADGAKDYLFEDDFEFVPFAELKYDDILNQWLPLPPTFNWMKPQDELNETREMQRIHRKRAVRRNTYDPNKIDADAVDRLVAGGDMSIEPATGENPIQPVPDAPLDAAVFRNLPTTKEDFIEISGVTGEQRGIAESETATQANILDARTRIRENFGREQVSKWLAKILWLMLRTIEDNMSLEFPIKLSVDPTSPFADQEALRVGYLWKMITADDIEPLNFEISVDLEELSPVTEEARREQWNQVLAIMSNEKLMMLLMSSETFLRKTLRFYGIRSEKEIAEVQKIGQGLIRRYMQMAMMQGGGGSTAGSPEAGNLPGPPDGEQIINQLFGQTGMLEQ